ncbi:lipoprotein-releasing system ATP-binding protein [Treponema bryantii]|uniref:Lipoprotein-releasing system ATP-binding protein n=1 Tax=Treponema bryantii TaxID=163 RepID=A0A1I3I7L6_9SPIR|nr:ABC transporter ATP-binding protein [Treponema bryantii]SFI43994.1 lipoprotein-releasing system ATP-binding protein [Treponema bryantii]
MIEAVNLNKSFITPRGRIDVLKDFSFSIENGAFVGITGKSGAGKSTLLSIIAGLQKPDSGSLVINGTDLLSLDDKNLSLFRNQNIGFVSQEQSFLENFTVLDNVRLPAFLGNKKVDDGTAKTITERANQLLGSLGIAHLAQNYPNTLSGGENHRVLIARALINNPAIILADEPTDSVDLEQTQSIIKIFRGLANEGKTILIASHDTEALKLCDSEIKI